MEIKSYNFDLIDEKMYLLKDKMQAVVIDPFVSEELIDDLKGYDDVLIILTHEHFDHISGVNFLKDKVNCRTICSKDCNMLMSNPNNNTVRFPLLFLADKEKYHYVKTHYKFPYSCDADIVFDDSYALDYAGAHFILEKMPAHTKGSIIIHVLTEDKYYLFSGDNVLGNEYELKTIEADSNYFWNEAIPKLEKMEQDKVIVMPGHGECANLRYFLEQIKSYKQN